jgi:predicted DNA-binding protein YlxM (UPF0122 family)|tara:strand:- start:333 stop:836 length:504 start_codon:yes stop_codon:yes gene_type:complete
MKYNFTEFCGLTKEEQIRLGTIHLNEDLSGTVKKKKMKQLESMLKSFDWWYSMSDDRRSYEKGSKEQDSIRKLVDEIGEDGMLIYKQYGKRAGVFESLKNQFDKEKSITKRIENVKEKHSIFPEMETSQRNIALGYGEGKVLANQHHFSNGVDDTTTKWTAPPKRKF